MAVTAIVVGIWYLNTNGNSPPLGATIIGFGFIFGLIPIYLIVCNIYILNVSFGKKALYSLLTISACMMVDYSIWGVLSGQFLTPDTATVTMFQNGISIAGATVFGVLIVREAFDAF